MLLKFKEQVEKYLEVGAEITPLYPIKTICSDYILGFCLQFENKKVGIEVTATKDNFNTIELLRDILILGVGQIDSIYRFTEKSIEQKIGDCIWLLSIYEPDFFSEKGHKVLDGMVSRTTKAIDIKRNSSLNIKYESPRKKIEEFYNTGSIDEDFIGEDLFSYDFTEFEESWEILFQVRSFEQTRKYDFNFSEFWTIINDRNLSEFEDIEKLFEEYISSAPLLIVE